MDQRLADQNLAPQVMQGLAEVEKYIRHCGLEPRLVELVKLRASQLNGCAYCVDIHNKNLRAAGETDPRLLSLPVWRETQYYTKRERAALAWAEAVTDIQHGHVPDEVYDLARQQFNEKELVDLTVALMMINGWNRLAISFRKPAGTYEPAYHATMVV